MTESLFLPRIRNLSLGCRKLKIFSEHPRHAPFTAGVCATALAAAKRPDLKNKMTAPDVLIQAHSASMGMIIYDGNQFLSEYSGDAFAAQHGSWNRGKRTGYKVIRARLKDGVPTGEYEDFMTGFVVNDSSV